MTCPSPYKCVLPAAGWLGSAFRHPQNRWVPLVRPGGLRAASADAVWVAREDTGGRRRLRRTSRIQRKNWGRPEAGRPQPPGGEIPHPRPSPAGRGEKNGPLPWERVARRPGKGPAAVETALRLCCCFWHSYFFPPPKRVPTRRATLCCIW